MSDQPITSIDLTGAAAPPRLSDEGIAYQRGLLNDAKWCEANAAHADMIRNTLAEALAASGQNIEPLRDERSPAQRLHDARFGLTFAPDGKIMLPSELAGVIERDAAGSAPDPKAVAAQLKAAGRDAEKVVAEAQALLDKIGSGVKATTLSAHAISQLSVYGAHLKKHAASRPRE